MKRYIVLIAFISVSTFAQTKYLTKTGSINFEASVPSFEEVAAKNNAVTAILNTDNGEFAALALVKAFRFKNALMEEHFNENYAESDAYPKATFKGKIEEFSLGAIGNTVITSKIQGELTFHGVTQPLKHVKISILKVEDSVSLFGSFSINPSDYNIEIPKIVSNKISDEVMVRFNFELLKK